jgi:hydrogenase-4 component F
MLIASLVLLPALAGAVALAVQKLRWSLAVMFAAALLHCGTTAALWLLPREAGSWLVELPPYLSVDVAGLLFLSLTSLLFLVSALSTIPYLRGHGHDPSVSPQRLVACLLWFLAAMTLVTVTQHLAIMWAAIEATTLASAPLIYFHRRKAALEAAWKYLLICSVGIALALLGTFFMGMAASGVAGSAPELALSSLVKVAPSMSHHYLKAAFVLVLVGYGTKMGLAPLHTWLPDAHSQAPSPVSALLSGALLNCAFLGILRFYQVCLAAGDAAFARELLLLLGFASLALAAGLMLGQRDYKRLFAYSSVENMGVIAIGIGIGGAATYGALLHAVNHSLVKAGLFLLAGNVLRSYGTTEANAVRGVLGRLPATGLLLVVGFLAVGGTPPFGPFMTEFMIFTNAMHSSPALAVLFVSLLGVAFLAMAGVLMPMLQGPSPEAPPPRESRLATVQPLALCAGVLCLGLYVPPHLGELLHRAAALIGG